MALDETFLAVAMFGGALATALVAALAILVVVALARRGEFTERGATLVLLFALGLIGGVIGFTVGLSRIGVVGDVVPAILTLFGGLSVYLFGIDRSQGLIASCCIVAFAACFFVQLMVGAQQRVSGEAFNMLAAHCLNTPSQQTYPPNPLSRQTYTQCNTIVEKLHKIGTGEEAGVPFTGTAPVNQ